MLPLGVISTNLSDSHSSLNVVCSHSLDHKCHLALDVAYLAQAWKLEAAELWREQSCSRTYVRQHPRGRCIMCASISIVSYRNSGGHDGTPPFRCITPHVSCSVGIAVKASSFA